MPIFFKTELLDNQIKILEFYDPSQSFNILGEKQLKELNDLIDEIIENDDIKGVVFTSGKKDFIVGADVSEIAKMENADETESACHFIQSIFSKISHLKIPSVAAINGQCLGGGLELALACDWRIVTTSASTKLALPEIQLGLIPGGGGTQRLPPLIGIQAALDLILTGKRIDGKKAVKIGLADQCVFPSILRTVAIQFAAKKKKSTNKFSSLSPNLGKDIPRWALDANPIGRKVLEKKSKELVDKNTKGFYPAPYKALDAVFSNFDKRIEKGLEIEAKFFSQLAHTKECHSLIHLFHGITHCKKIPYQTERKEKFGSATPNRVGIIGAGFMGAGIATICADRNIHARLSDTNKEATGRALANAHQFFSKKAERKKLKSFEVAQKLALISPSLKKNGLKNCQLIIEAVYEDLTLKQEILREIEESAPDDQVYASNTSAIPIKDIAEVAKKPERVVGMHFFSPVEKMSLVELIETEMTEKWASGQAAQLGQAMGKHVIVVKDSPGFFTTRVLAFLLSEAALILGTMSNEPSQIDRSLTDFGFPIGPITLIDEVGIDVGFHVLETMEKAFSSRISAPNSLKAVLDSGRLGKKNGQGFYLYDDGHRTIIDDQMITLLRNHESKLTEIPPDEIVDRCMLILINESVRCLDEGILYSPYAGDIGGVFGLGFPAFWGGPFKYIDHIGSNIIVDRLNSLADKYGERFLPAHSLVENAKKGTKFFPTES